MLSSILLQTKLFEVSHPLLDQRPWSHADDLADIPHPESLWWPWSPKEDDENAEDNEENKSDDETSSEESSEVESED